MLECFRWIYLLLFPSLFIFYFLLRSNKIDLEIGRFDKFSCERRVEERKTSGKRDGFDWTANETDRAGIERDAHRSKDSRRLALLRPLLPRYNCRLPLQRREKGGCNRQILLRTLPLLFSYSFIHSINPRIMRILLHPITRISHWYTIENTRVCVYQPLVHRYFSLKISDFFSPLNRR